MTIIYLIILNFIFIHSTAGYTTNLSNNCDNGYACPIGYYCCFNQTNCIVAVKNAYCTINNCLSHQTCINNQCSLSSSVNKNNAYILICISLLIPFLF